MYIENMCFLTANSWRSVSAAPYRSRSVVNLHHQDTETDEATMILPPEDYVDSPKRAAVKTHHPSSTFVTTNNHWQHSPTPSAVSSSSSSDHHTVSLPAHFALFISQVGRQTFLRHILRRL